MSTHFQQAIQATSDSRARAQLCRVAARYVGDEAEDMVQEAFVRALQRPQSFRQESSALTWVARIVINASIDEWRRRRRQSRLALRAEAAPSTTDLPCERLMLGRALRVLPADERRLCILFDVLGYSHREIASTLDMPVGTSKSKLSTARRRLRAELR